MDFPMPSTSSCTRESRMCPGHWGGLLEGWQRKISTSSPAIRQSRKIPRRQAWCLKFLIWRKRSARTEALLLTDWTTDRVMALVQEHMLDRDRHELSFSSLQGGVPDPQSRTGSFGDSQGPADLLRGGRGWILDISARNEDLVRHRRRTLLGVSGISIWVPVAASGMNMGNRRKPLPRTSTGKSLRRAYRRLGTTNSARKSLFHLIFLCALFHFALSHLDRHDVNFVLGGILMGFERYLMPFMALQGVWVGHRPALVVLVDERFSVSANFA